RPAMISSLVEKWRPAAIERGYEPGFWQKDFEKLLPGRSPNLLASMQAAGSYEDMIVLATGRSPKALSAAFEAQSTLGPFVTDTIGDQATDLSYFLDGTCRII